MKLYTQITFSKEVEKIVKDNDISIIDAILEMCDITGIEVESVGKLLTPTLKLRLKDEAETLNFFKEKTVKLDFLK